MIFERECISADGNLKQTLNFLSYFDVSFFTGDKHNLNNTDDEEVFNRKLFEYY